MDLNSKILNIETNEINMCILQNNLRYIEDYLHIKDSYIANEIGVTRQTIYNIKYKKKKISKMEYLSIIFVIYRELITEDNIEYVYLLLTKNFDDIKKIIAEEIEKIVKKES